MVIVSYINPDAFSLGNKILTALEERRDLTVKALLWKLQNGEITLLVAVQEFDKQGPLHVITKIQDTIRKEGIAIPLEDIHAVSPNSDPLLKALRRDAIRIARSQRGVHVGPIVTERGIVDDVVIHRFVR